MPKDNGKQNKDESYINKYQKHVACFKTLLNVDFNNSTKYWICDNVYIDNDVKSKFLQKSGFKWIDTKEFGLNKYSSNSSKGCSLELIFNIVNNYLNCPIIILLSQLNKNQIKNVVKISSTNS